MWWQGGQACKELPKEQIRQLKRQLEDAEQELAFYRLRVRAKEPAECMKLVKPGQGLSIRKQCAAVKVPVSSYCYRPNPPSAERRRLAAEAGSLHSVQTSMGTRRQAQQLQRKDHRCSSKLVGKVMDEQGLRSLSPGPHSSTKRRRGAVPAPNLLEQGMPSAPNRIWSSDLTLLRVGRGIMHAAIIIEVCSRLIVGIRLSNTPDAELCLNTLAQACSRYGCPTVLHNDKGLNTLRAVSGTTCAGAASRRA